MPNIGRYNLSEISATRLYSATKARYTELPHSITWFLQSAAHKNRKKIYSFSGKHSNQRCFIVANGPSLVRTNLEMLKDEITFGLNRIYLHFENTSFRPTYYLAVNELVLEQFADEISHLEMTKFLNWNRRSLYGFDDHQLIYLKSRMVIKDKFQKDVTHPLVMGGTVTFVALQLAYYMGFQKVILVGLDHSYVEKGIPSVTETRIANRDESHFHPDYFPKGVKWQLPDLLRSEVDYRLARDAFELDGREILDATIDGKCQIFKKVDYLSLFD